jgi:predicted nucleic-acid-binding protein
LDSSILVRYILEDDPIWSGPAVRFINTACTPDNAGYVNSIVLAEIAWALRQKREFTRERMSRVVNEFLEADSLRVENEGAVRRALVNFEKHGAGFADCLIAELNADAGAKPTFAIDKDAIGGRIFTRMPKDGKP